MQCRMCSQRLTGPGKLCPECERELDCGQTLPDGGSDAFSHLSARVDGADAAAWPMTTRWPALLRSRGVVAAAAFAMAAAGAATLYLVQRASASGGQAMESLSRADVPATESPSRADDKRDVPLRNIETGPAAVATAQQPPDGLPVAETTTGQDVRSNSPSR